MTTQKTKLIHIAQLYELHPKDYKLRPMGDERNAERLVRIWKGRQPLSFGVGSDYYAADFGGRFGLYALYRSDVAAGVVVVIKPGNILEIYEAGGGADLERSRQIAEEHGGSLLNHQQILAALDQNGQAKDILKEESWFWLDGTGMDQDGVFTFGKAEEKKSKLEKTAVQNAEKLRRIREILAEK